MTPAASLPPSAIPVETLAIIDSTNAEARRRAASGSRGPIWLRAEAQSAGAGRSGRAWHSPPGNLYATLLLPWAGEVGTAALMSFVACLAVADTLDRYASQSSVTLKWPNDALLEGKKVAGVLLEAGGSDDTRWLAIGIGINLAHKPDDARWPPIALSDIAAPPEPGDAMATLAQAFDRWHSRFETEGFAPIREAWLARAARLGERIEARLANATHTGLFEGIADDGALLLAADQGDIRIAAADIHFPT